MLSRCPPRSSTRKVVERDCRSGFAWLNLTLTVPAATPSPKRFELGPRDTSIASTLYRSNGMLLLLAKFPHVVLAPPAVWPDMLTPRIRFACCGLEATWSLMPPDRLRLNVVK